MSRQELENILFYFSISYKTETSRLSQTLETVDFRPFIITVAICRYPILIL